MQTLTFPLKRSKRTFKKQLLEALENLENSFKESSYGLDENKKMNLLLQKLASSADTVLDLHTGPSATRYLYCAEYAQEDGKNLLFPYNLIIPNEFAGAMDEASFTPWVLLAKEFEKRGRPLDPQVYAYTLELGSEEAISSSEAKDDTNKILHYLFSKGMLKNAPFKNKSVQNQENEMQRPLSVPLSSFKTYLCSPRRPCRISQKTRRILFIPETLSPSFTVLTSLKTSTPFSRASLN